MNLNATEVAWAAGLLEGDGHFGTMNDGRSLRVKLNLTDYDVTRRFADTFGASVNGPYDHEHKDGHVRKPYWRTDIVKRDLAMTIMGAVWPHPGKRRRIQVKNSILRWKNHPGRNGHASD